MAPGQPAAWRLSTGGHFRLGQAASGLERRSVILVAESTERGTTAAIRWNHRRTGKDGIGCRHEDGRRTVQGHPVGGTRPGRARGGRAEPPRHRDTLVPARLRHGDPAHAHDRSRIAGGWPDGDQSTDAAPARRAGPASGRRSSAASPRAGRPQRGGSRVVHRGHQARRDPGGRRRRRGHGRRGPGRHVPPLGNQRRPRALDRACRPCHERHRRPLETLAHGHPRQARRI